MKDAFATAGILVLAFIPDHCLAQPDFKQQAVEAGAPLYFPPELSAPVFEHTLTPPAFDFAYARAEDMDHDGIDEAVIHGGGGIAWYDLRNGRYELEGYRELSDRLAGENRLLIGDFDGNGLADLLDPINDTDLYWLTPEGTERHQFSTLKFQSIGTPPADFDGDGFDDLFDTRDRVIFYGSADRRFEEVSYTATLPSRDTLLFFDFEGDGDLDSYTERRDESLGTLNPVVIVNNGDRTWTEHEITGNRLYVRSYLGFLDTTGDGQRELVLAVSENGRGTLLVIGAGPGGTPEIVQRVLYPKGELFKGLPAMRVLDLDGDGREELAGTSIERFDPSLAPNIRFSVDDSWRDETLLRADINGDGALDFVESREFRRPQQLSIAIADSNGRRVDRTRVGSMPRLGGTRRVVRQYTDLLTTGTPSNQAVDGSRFETGFNLQILEDLTLVEIDGSDQDTPPPPSGTGNNPPIITADIDGDGHLDRALIDYEPGMRGSRIFWRPQVRLGVFADEYLETPIVKHSKLFGQWRNVVYYDLNRDGSLWRIAVIGLIEQNVGRGLRVDRMTPSGFRDGFELQAPAFNEDIIDLRFRPPLLAVDFTGDGITDLIFDTPESEQLLYVGRPNGEYEPGVSIERISYPRVAPGPMVYDYDRDGDEDVIFFSTPWKVLINNGTTSPELLETDIFYPIGETEELVLADFDGDRIDDLLVYGDFHTGPAFLLRGSAAPFRLEDAEYYWLYETGLMDVNGDGLPDQFGVEFDENSETTLAGSALLNQSCAFDLNHDGLLDINDLKLFIARFRDRRPEADLNGDGRITGQDIRVFIEAFIAGC